MIQTTPILTKLSEEDYKNLADFAFSEQNPGFKPKEIESPNGNGVWDESKRYTHIAPKYFRQVLELVPPIVIELYAKAINECIRVCNAIELPHQFWPGPDSTMRLLDYPPGASTAPHTDFNLFTLCLYRDDMDAFKYLGGEGDPLLKKAREISPGIHFGEMMTEINGAQATGHEVVGTDKPQRSIVFFMVPRHSATLPSGKTVGQWIEERKRRSRRFRI